MEFSDIWKFGATWEPHKVKMPVQTVSTGWTAFPLVLVRSQGNDFGKIYNADDLEKLVKSDPSFYRHVKNFVPKSVTDVEEQQRFDVPKTIDEASHDYFNNAFRTMSANIEFLHCPCQEEHRGYCGDCGMGPGETEHRFGCPTGKTKACKWKQSMNLNIWVPDEEVDRYKENMRPLSYRQMVRCTSHPGQLFEGYDGLYGVTLTYSNGEVHTRMKMHYGTSSPDGGHRFSFGQTPSGYINERLNDFKQSHPNLDFPEHVYTDQVSN